jgi:hypothetical protein
MKKYHNRHHHLDSQNLLNAGVEVRFTIPKDVNELKTHSIKQIQQSLQILIFYKHVLVFFIVACNILVVMYFLVISIRRPPFIVVSPLQ